MRASRRARGGVLAIAAVLGGCALGPFGGRPGVGTGGGSTLQGHVDVGALSSGRRSPFSVLATMSSVATGATVSLVDVASGQTLATTLTDASGNFAMSLGAFRPTSALYYLEAIKGLGTNAANNDAMRVRTLIQWNGSGWVSMASGTPGPVLVDTGTTTLSLIMSLRASTPSPVTGNALGAINDAATPNAFTPGSLNVTPAEYAAVYALVDQAFANNADPFTAVAYNTATGGYRYVGAAHVVTSISPTSGPVGTSFAISGTGFDPTASNDTVQLNGAAVTLTAASSTSLSGSVPAGATTGQVTVQIGNLVYLGPTFTVGATPWGDGGKSVFDSAGNMYYVSSWTLLRISPTGTVTAVSTGLNANTFALGVGPDGYLWSVDQGGDLQKTNLSTYAVTNVTTLAGATNATGLAFRPDGKVWVTAQSNAVLYDPGTNTIVQTVPMPAFYSGGACVCDSAGDLFFQSGMNAGIVEITPTYATSVLTTYASATAGGLVLDATGTNLYTLLGTSIYQIPIATPATQNLVAGSLANHTPTNLALHGGTLYGNYGTANVDQWTTGGVHSSWATVTPNMQGNF